MSQLRRAGPANEVGFAVQTLGMEPVLRPLTALMCGALAFALATWLFTLEAQDYRYLVVPGCFLALAVALGIVRHLRPPAPLPSPERIRTARAALGLFGTDQVSLDFDDARDPWLKLEASGVRIELAGDGASPTIAVDGTNEADLRQRLEAVLSAG